MVARLSSAAAADLGEVARGGRELDPGGAAEPAAVERLHLHCHDAVAVELGHAFAHARFRPETENRRQAEQDHCHDGCCDGDVLHGGSSGEAGGGDHPG
jgi:hypothetical protein